MGSIGEAKVAASKVFSVIDRTPQIDIFSEQGDTPSLDNFKIEFKKVHFTYPSRKNVEVNIFGSSMLYRFYF